MSNDMIDLKKTWGSVATDPDENLKEFRQALQQWRSRKQRAVFLWYSTVLLFSAALLCYIIYTDDLNSNSRSASEIILLLVSIYLLGYAWRRINRERKEYMLNSIDFVETLPVFQLKRNYRELLLFCSVATLVSIAVFLYGVDLWGNTGSQIAFALSGLVIVIVVVWLIIRPLLWKVAKRKNKILSAKIAKILKYD